MRFKQVFLAVPVVITMSSCAELSEGVKKINDGLTSIGNSANRVSNPEYAAAYAEAGDAIERAISSSSGYDKDLFQASEVIQTIAATAACDRSGHLGALDKYAVAEGETKCDQKRAPIARLNYTYSQREHNCLSVERVGNLSRKPGNAMGLSILFGVRENSQTTDKDFVLNNSQGKWLLERCM